ncbi:MAG: MerR family transcriptional regulator [Bacteroidales bacterium]|nr:MerR family transcriptional regulator [Bacteroidales bacterium]MCF8403499.1 MerR family transcriptional regulator [Bacteroidales bacterium]
MANYSIKDLENFTGIKAHTIRMWEKRYNIVEPKRTETNIRFYDDEDLKKLLNVSILNRNGVKISNIVGLNEKAICDKILTLAITESDVESQIESLVIAMIDLDENKFDKVFNTAIINHGFEESIVKVIYPFFEKIGILWQIGAINPAQEHFVSNLIRQKLIVATDGIVSTFNDQTKSFLLYLPEGEFHELGLLFYYYLIKKHNHKVFYLGESVPHKAVMEIGRAKKIDYVLTFVITPTDEEKFRKEIYEIIDNFSDLRHLYISGLNSPSVQNNLPPSVSVVRNVVNFRSILEDL